MILQALYEYYQRKPDMPKHGFENKEIKFVIVIKKDGTFVDLVDKREGKKGKEYLLPRAKGRSGANSWQTTFLLWDHYGYVLSHPKDLEKKSVEMAKKQNAVFVETIQTLPEQVKKDVGVKAILLFYETGQAKEVKKHPNWEDCSKIPGCNLTFQLDGDPTLIPQREAISDYQTLLFADGESDQSDGETEYEAPCLITGKRGSVARLHTATPILGAKSNAKIVAFQKSSGFDSYGKEQAFNAPISKKAEAAYSTALKHLTTSATNRVMIADSTTVFWAEKKALSFDLEQQFIWYLSDPPKDDADRGVKAVRALFEATYSGKLPLEEENRFYVLGLAPNAARISVRFWKVGTVTQFAEKIKLHFDDFTIAHGPKEPEHLSLNQILRATVLEYKMDNVPPNLAAAVVESILDGTPYPITLMQQCIRRIRAEQHVNRARAAILKAYINRLNRIHNQNTKEVQVALDLTNINPGYRLGRLFATLEKIQEEAQPGINATIRDRFYGAASSTPVSVFSQLLKLKNHHLAKLENVRRRIVFEKLIGEICSEMQSFPSNLSMNEQAYFSLGYYHQRQDFFVSRKNSNDSKEN